MTYLSYLSLLLLFGLAAGGCGRGSAKSPERDPVAGMDSLPEEVQSVIRAVVNNDSVAFSSLVNYPLARPYPLHDIKDSVEMRSYFPVLVDDSLRKVIAESAPRTGERPAGAGGPSATAVTYGSTGRSTRSAMCRIRNVRAGMT